MERRIPMKQLLKEIVKELTLSLALGAAVGLGLSQTTQRYALEGLLEKPTATYIDKDDIPDLVLGPTKLRLPLIYLGDRTEQGDIVYRRISSSDIYRIR